MSAERITTEQENQMSKNIEKLRKEGLIKPINKEELIQDHLKKKDTTTQSLFK